MIIIMMITMRMTMTMKMIMLILMVIMMMVIMMTIIAYSTNETWTSTLSTSKPNSSQIFLVAYNLRLTVVLFSF